MYKDHIQTNMGHVRSNLEDKSYLFTKLCSDGIGPPVNVIFLESDRVRDLVSKRNYSVEWLNPLGTADWPVVRQTRVEEGEDGGWGCFCSVVQAFIDPLSNTDQHLVVVADFPMGPVKITAGSPALPPTTRLHPHGPTDTIQRGRIKS